MTLLLVDGTNAMMRRAMVMQDMSAQDIADEVAHRMLRAAKELRCGHLIVAFDDVTNWRYDEFPAYKGSRENTVDTTPYARVAWKLWRALGFKCVLQHGFEADDVIATLAYRTAQSKRDVFTLSSDNDLLQLLMWDHVRVMQYNHDRKGPWLVERDADFVVQKFGILPSDYAAYLALVGGKNDVPGIPKIGAKTAVKILNRCVGHGAVFESEHIPDEHKEWGRQAHRLHSLRLDAPVPAIIPAEAQVPLLSVA